MIRFIMVAKWGSKIKKHAQLNKLKRWIVIIWLVSVYK